MLTSQLNYASVNYDHLRPPHKCLNIKPSSKTGLTESYRLEHEIIEKSDNPIIPYKRHIFYTVDLQKEEQ